MLSRLPGALQKSPLPGVTNPFVHRSTVCGGLPALPREVLLSQSATRLPQTPSGSAGHGRRGGRRRPVGPPVPLRLPAPGRGALGPRPSPVRVHLQKMPRQVLQVPQHPDPVPAESEPPCSREGEPESPVSQSRVYPSVSTPCRPL